MKKYLENLERINRKFKLGHSPAKLNKVVARLEMVKADPKDDQDWLSALNGTVFAMDANPLEQEAKQKAIGLNQICSLCGNKGEKITLMGGRQAYYCKTHRNVQPVVAEDR